MINNTKYYLNDTDLVDPDTGGVCVTNCTGAFYEGEDNFTCLPCQAGCAECHYKATNCTSCTDINANGSQKAFLQPDSNTCSTTCPTSYFKQINYKCEQCSSHYGDWDWLTNPVTNPCTDVCNVNCSQCYGSSNTTCLACTGTAYLQVTPGTG